MNTEPAAVEWTEEVAGEKRRDPAAQQTLDAEIVSEWEQFVALVGTTEGQAS